MTAFQFGRMMKRAFELPKVNGGAGAPPAPPAPAPAPPSPPPPAPVAAPKPATPPPMPANNPNAGTGNRGSHVPGFLESYGNVLDRWYNPWTKQQVTERGEHGLMRAGQTAMGIGAAAGTAAAGIAAAPAIAGAANTVGNAATAAGSRALATAGGAGTWAANQLPKAQQFVSNQAQRGGQMLNNAVAGAYNSPVGHAARHLWGHYNEAIEPFDRAGMTSPVEFPAQLGEFANHAMESAHEFMPGSAHAGMH